MGRMSMREMQHPKLRAPPCEVRGSRPWDQLGVDLVGPLTVTIDRKNDQSHMLTAMTFIDPATGWFEVAEIDSKDSASISQKLDQVRLSRYPQPRTSIFDNGSEFKNDFRYYLGTTAFGLD